MPTFSFGLFCPVVDLMPRLHIGCETVTQASISPPQRGNCLIGPPFERANLYGEAGLQAWLADLRPNTRVPRLDFALTAIS
jgi:hypothetical protein